ncbi:DNA-binding protein [Poseidonibacter ostreae]|uniref:DNA-binding protein n=1 Tax=Poseidonibacter ostreae TaxID=2654171 RepID=A0ABQ6VJD7_9BACT|nr:DNA-binding protein [Poseidonibacter ostreae]KAB7888966.1 DNA-binding protein [Poseidonibacter ostreae]
MSISKLKEDIIKEKLRAKTIAYRYEVGLSTVWLYAKQGKLTPIKISKRVTLFDIDEVSAFFNGKR